MEIVDAKTIWDVKTFVMAASGDRRRARMPALKEMRDGEKRMVEENEEKVRILNVL